MSRESNKQGILTVKVLLIIYELLHTLFIILQQLLFSRSETQCQRNIHVVGNPNLLY